MKRSRNPACRAARTKAHQVLDAARRGEPVSVDAIRDALVVTGDLVSLGRAEGAAGVVHRTVAVGSRAGGAMLH